MTSLAYLADVFVLPAHRGQGLGRAQVAKMIDAGPGAEFRWLLHTADAHGLYAGLGFMPAVEPARTCREADVCQPLRLGKGLRRRRRLSATEAEPSRLGIAQRLLGRDGSELQR